MKGTRAPIREGLIIGRRKGTLTIRDSKLSSKHAGLDFRPDGSVWLIDLGSANGIKLPSGGRVRELQLQEGVDFILGQTPFRVFSSEEELPDLAEAGATVTRHFWDRMKELAQRGTDKTRVSPRELVPLNPILRLIFTRGIQAGTEWTIGYGPRTIGTASLDLALEEPQLPAQCFRLIPQHDGVLFKNETRVEVKLNGAWVESGFLRDGDVIEIVNTQIQVVFDASN